MHIQLHIRQIVFTVVYLDVLYFGDGMGGELIYIESTTYVEMYAVIGV
jgi:hypothetical protein